MAPWYRYETTDPTLHGPWTLVDPAFASIGDRAIGSISTPGFYSLPNPQQGDPTHVINGGMGGAFYTAHFDEATEKLSNLSTKAYHVGGSWSVAGESERDGILHIGWIGMGNPPYAGSMELDMMSAVRVLSYERATEGLVTNPLPAYTTLRNATLAKSKTTVVLQPGSRSTPALPAGTGAAIDIEISLALPTTGELAFALEVLAVASGGQVNHTSGEEIGAGSIGVNISAPISDGTRRGQLFYRGRHQKEQGSQRFLVLKGEQSVDIRVLVDRVIVEVFAAGGRATLTGREFSQEGETAVHMLAAGTQPVHVSSFAIWSMGCGWL
jgi:sucrose-6-phosphate hydrolase SacC (GH32 family)